MNDNTFNVCPRCNRNDAIRKVSAIVSSGSFRGAFAGPTPDICGDFGIALVGGSALSHLVQMVTPPEQPRKGVFKDSPLRVISSMAFI
jgi:hypothetical protein